MSSSQVATTPEDRQCRKYLMVTGDDFGLNSEVNEAVERFHQAGILTQASLMVNEGAVDEALRIARRNPGLTLGLHLSLCCAKGSQVSALTDSAGRFVSSPARAGLRYAFERRLTPVLTREIEAQFDRFVGFALPPAYWDGHTHLHLHPGVLALTLPIAARFGFQAVRLVREPGRAPLQIIFRLLSRAAAPKLMHRRIRFADHVFGLCDTGQMSTRRFELLLAGLPAGWNEIYFHPGAEPGELDTQLIAEWIALRQIRLANARELPAIP